MQITPQGLLKTLVGVAIAALIITILWYFSSVVVYILVSAVLAVMGRPLVRYIERLHIRQWKVPRTLAAIVTLLFIWVVAAAFAMLFVPLVFDKLNELVNLDLNAVMATIEEPIHRLQEHLAELFAMPAQQLSLSEALISFVREWINFESLNVLLQSTVGLMFSTVVTLFSISFITFFFLKEDGLFYSMITACFPERYAGNITRALDEVTYLLSRYFRGILTESLLLMVAIIIVLSSFGMKPADAAFIALVMGVMNVVPYAGPLLGGIISAAFGVVTPIEGTTVAYTVTVIVCSLLTLKGLDDFILQPTLYSERVKAHPLEVFIVILLAGSAAGILGMLLAIPAYTVLRVFAKEFFSEFSLVRKLTENI